MISIGCSWPRMLRGRRCRTGTAVRVVWSPPIGAASGGSSGCSGSSSPRSRRGSSPRSRCSSAPVLRQHHRSVAAWHHAMRIERCRFWVRGRFFTGGPSKLMSSSTRAKVMVVLARVTLSVRGLLLLRRGSLPSGVSPTEGFVVAGDDEAGLVCHDDGLCPVACPQLGEDPCQVSFDGGHGQVELPSDLVVGESRGDAAQHLAFSVCEA